MFSSAVRTSFLLARIEPSQRRVWGRLHVQEMDTVDSGEKEGDRLVVVVVDLTLPGSIDVERLEVGLETSEPLEAMEMFE